MEICTAHVERITYIGRFCPACAEVSELQREIGLLNDRIQQLEEEKE